MDNITLELLALIVALAGTLIVAFSSLKKSAEAQSIASSTTSQLLETLGDFAKTLQANNQERELWQSDRRILERRIVSLETQLEVVKSEAQRQVESAKAESQRQLDIVKQESTERERRLISEIEGLRAMLVLEREQRQREVKALRDDLEIERRKRREAEDAKAHLAAQLEQVRHELTGKQGVEGFQDSTEQLQEAEGPKGLEEVSQPSTSRVNESTETGD